MGCAASPLFCQLLMFGGKAVRSAASKRECGFFRQGGWFFWQGGWFFLKSLVLCLCRAQEPSVLRLLQLLLMSLFFWISGSRGFSACKVQESKIIHLLLLRLSY